MIKLITRSLRYFSQEKPIDYAQLANQIMSAQGENEQLRLAVNKIIMDMRGVIEQAYQSKYVDEILQNVRSYHLCVAAVEQYVGSMYTPKNEAITQLFLDHAIQNAKTQEEALLAQYYANYIKKLDAAQTGNKLKFDQANEELIDLAQENCFPAKHMMAKEMYKVAMNMMSSKQKKDKEKLLKEAYKIFYECAQNEFHHSFYYLGELAERGDIPGGIDLKFAFECQQIASAYANPGALFKMSRFYKEGIICERNEQLEFHYMKRAAELGLLDAQHNLAVMYKEGRLVKKDDLKALAWFTQAGNFGFPMSMFNAGMMHWEGGEGIRRNRTAALVWFEKLQKNGSLDVSRQIKKLVQEIEKDSE